MAAHTPTRSRIESQISGALRDCINKHGPITEKTIGSAAKRVYGTLYGGNDAPEPEVPANGHRLPLSELRLLDKNVTIRVGDVVDVAPSKKGKHDGWEGEVMSLFQDKAGPTVEVRHPNSSARYVALSRIRGRKRAKA